MSVSFVTLNADISSIQTLLQQDTKGVTIGKRLHKKVAKSTQKVRKRLHKNVAKIMQHVATLHT